jgi:integrase
MNKRDTSTVVMVGGVPPKRAARTLPYAGSWSISVRKVRTFATSPIRLHDLRHGAATLQFGCLASHTDLKVIQQMLGHSRIITTADT